MASNLKKAKLGCLGTSIAGLGCSAITFTAILSMLPYVALILLIVYLIKLIAG